jgi:hypothetical protein
MLASTAIVAELPVEDYRLAFGEEPWDIVAVGVMTDARNTHGKASAQYGAISFRPER